MSVTAKEIADALGTTPEKLAAVLAGGEKLIARTEQRAAVLRAQHEQAINEAPDTRCD